jgi:hypothetical protein
VLINPFYAAAMDEVPRWRRHRQLFYTAFDGQETSMTQAAILITQGEVQLVAGILAVLLIAIVLFRRKGKKKSEEDEF